MICIHVTSTVCDENDVGKIGELLAEHARLSRAEPGCLRFELYHSESDPKVFLVGEHWESQDVLDTHRTAKGYLEIYKPQILPCVERVAHILKLVEPE